MPQEFQVVRCCACNTFQNQQKKKLSKWQCKMCNKKQSLNRVYGEGNSTECRRHVQKLNMVRSEIDKEPKISPMPSTVTNEYNCQDQTIKQSKWAIFIDSSSDSEIEMNHEEEDREEPNHDSLLPTKQNNILLSDKETMFKNVSSEVNQTPVLSFTNAFNNIDVDELDSIFEL